MYVPKWIVAMCGLIFLFLATFAFLLAADRNPLPFPDRGSRIFAASSPAAKDAVVELLARHGLNERFQFNTDGVLRSVLWDGTIINYSSPEVAQKLRNATSSIGIVADDPASS